MEGILVFTTTDKVVILTEVVPKEERVSIAFLKELLFLKTNRHYDETFIGTTTTELTMKTTDPANEIIFLTYKRLLKNGNKNIRKKIGGIKKVFKKIKQIIVEQSVCDEEDIKLETEIDDLKLSSLDKIELLMALEEEFNVEISGEKAELVKTVADIVKTIRQLKK